MKKFYKNALITAGILFAAGAVISVICVFVGGSSFHNDVKSGNISELVSLFHFNIQIPLILLSMWIIVPFILISMTNIPFIQVQGQTMRQLMPLRSSTLI